MYFQHQAIESTITAIGFADAEGRLTYVNAALLRLWGYEHASEMLGRHVSSFSASEEQTRETLTGIYEQGVWVGEVVGRKKNGDTFVANMSASLVKDVAGKVLGTMGSFVDITEQKRIREALQQSEERYRTLVESAEDPIVISDEVGRYLFVNTAAAARFGTTPDKITGTTFADWFPPRVAETYLADRKRVFETGQTLISESSMEIRGKEVWFNTIAQPLRDPQGRVVAVQAIVRDITRLKRTEEALRESEERLRQVVRVSNIGIFDHNHVTDAIYISPQQREIIGWDQTEQVSGREFPRFDDALQVVHPDDRARVESEIRRAHAGGNGGVCDSEYRILRRNGTVRWVTSRSQTFFENGTEDRQPVRTVGALRDITDQKQAEDERARLHGQLVQAHKMESVGRLAGGVAHDFNNMLEVILGHTELIMGQVDPTGPIFADLQQVKNAAQRSADLTRQLLAFARKQPIAPKVISINDVVAGSLQMLRRMIGEDIHLAWIPGHNLWSVRIDPTQVHQILANLAANARDAIAGVGKLTIRTANVSFDTAYCMKHTGFLPGEYVALEVTDNGRGIDPETQAHIFEPFYTTKGEGEGTGLGLATVYGVVQQNEGLIEARSEVGRGTTVKIFLPRYHAEAAVALPHEDEEALKSGTETVLLVEDEPMVLKLNTRSLEHLGYSVLAAGSPREAIRLAEENLGNIHLLITDVVMPKMNGRDLAEKLTTIDPHLKKLFVSGYPANTLTPRGALDEGVHFLQKPFSLNDLANKVREILDA